MVEFPCFFVKLMTAKRRESPSEFTMVLELFIHGDQLNVGEFYVRPWISGHLRDGEAVFIIEQLRFNEGCETLRIKQVSLSCCPIIHGDGLLRGRQGDRINGGSGGAIHFTNPPALKDATKNPTETAFTDVSCNHGVIDVLKMTRSLHDFRVIELGEIFYAIRDLSWHVGENVAEHDIRFVDIDKILSIFLCKIELFS